VTGFVGLGRMGSRMAARLLAAGHELRVYDVVAEAAAPLVARGAVGCASVAEVAASSQVIFTSLPGPAEIDAVVAGKDGIAARAASGSLVIETSTIGVQQSRMLAERCAERGIRFLDAPVSGGIAGAEAGTLSAMVGGPKSDLEDALPYLRAVASHVYHLGAHGSGATAKLINQIIYLSYAAVFCEATAFGAAEGLDVRVLVDALRQSVGGQPLSTHWESHIETGDYSPGFHIRRALKDLELGGEAIAGAGYDAPVFQSALRAFRRAAEAGYADCDIAALHASRTERTARV
jgi:3-hydroxyisobutyrate dehydrogenase-like beta-hydroxyacid dehydrogenase